MKRVMAGGIVQLPGPFDPDQRLDVAIKEAAR
jgi:hypothetical protein